MLRKNTSGQALIIIVLIIAFVLTVITASSYQLTVQTEGSKLQEESVRALAAADAGIEVGLQLANTNNAPQSYTFASQGLNMAGVNATRSTIIVTSASQTDFISSLVLKDEQFTFYTKDYPLFADPSYEGWLRISFGSEGVGDCNTPRSRPALELTVIYGNNNNIERRVVEPCTSGQVIQGNSGSFTSYSPISETIDGVTFKYRVADINMSSFTNAKMILVRSLFGSTRLRFLAQSSQFPNQGKWIEARAYSLSGPSKIVRVFQSLPQVPADFFVTSF